MRQLTDEEEVSFLTNEHGIKIATLLLRLRDLWVRDPSARVLVYSVCEKVRREEKRGEDRGGDERKKREERSGEDMLTYIMYMYCNNRTFICEVEYSPSWRRAA